MCSGELQYDHQCVKIVKRLDIVITIIAKLMTDWGEGIMNHTVIYIHIGLSVMFFPFTSSYNIVIFLQNKQMYE